MEVRDFWAIILIMGGLALGILFFAFLYEENLNRNFVICLAVVGLIFFFVGVLLKK